MQVPREVVDSTRLGEVVEATSAGFTVHCYRLYGAAPLGSLVHTSGDAQVYGVVRNVATLPLDPARRPVARGQDEEDEAAVYRSNPQLPALLRTDFEATVLGHGGDDGLRYGLPPQPPRVHAFVYACQLAEVREFTQRLDFLPLLFANAPPLADQVVAAFLCYAAHAHEDADAFLATAARQVARLLSRDLQRLQSILQSLRP